jgi:hypothetical protein
MNFGTETPKSMQFSHKSNVNFQSQKYGTSTDLATLSPCVQEQLMLPNKNAALLFQS